jgi:hypothetical protein
LGDYQRAQFFFERCATGRLFRSPAILFGIDLDSIFAVHLRSASDYIGLMLLNAAWSSFKSGAPDLAVQYAQQAREFAVAPSLEEPTQADHFLASLEAVVARARLVGA